MTRRAAFRVARATAKAEHREVCVVRDWLGEYSIGVEDDTHDLIGIVNYIDEGPSAES